MKGWITALPPNPHPMGHNQRFPRHLTRRKLEQQLCDVLGIPAGASLCVAYSGGMDSHVLLHALARLAPDYPFQLRAIHVDHGLHDDSPGWSKHCEEVCSTLDIPLLIRQVDIAHARGDSLEASARKARYAVLSAELDQDEYCLTAQHLDDQAETVLLQLLRGAGMHGLAGMPALAELGQGYLARPLLVFPRTALSDYAQRHQLHWIDDPSNLDERHDRNYLRHRVMPLLTGRWPGAPTALARSARHAASAALALEREGRVDLAACHAFDTGSVFEPACLDVSLLRQLPESRQANALRCWIREHGRPLPSDARLMSAVHDLLRNNRSGRGEIAWLAGALRLDGDTLYLCSKLPAAQDTEMSLEWNPVLPLLLPDRGLWLRATIVTGQGIDLSRVGIDGLTVRWRKGGERCRMGADAGHKPLRKLFQDLSVPYWQRDRILLIYLGDTLAAVDHYWTDPGLGAKPGGQGLVFSVHEQR